MDDWIKTSDQLFKWRRKHGFTLSQAANIVGCSRTEFDSAERGIINPERYLTGARDYDLNHCKNEECEDDARQGGLF